MDFAAIPVPFPASKTIGWVVFLYPVFNSYFSRKTDADPVPLEICHDLPEFYQLFQ